MVETGSDSNSMGVRCSFCLKPKAEVAQIIAGPGSYICDECVARCVEILSPATADFEDGDRPRVPSWSSMTDQQILHRLPAILVVEAQVEGALGQWVAECRRRGESWAKIGAALDMSRQSAWERFSDVS